MSRCVCCDLPVDSCGKAVEVQRRRDAQKADTALRARGFVSAKYPGECAGCGQRIEPGELIGWSDSSTGWIGPCCA